MPSFLPSVPANGETVAFFNPTYARCSVRAIGNVTLPNIDGQFLSPLNALWTHIEHNMSIGEGGDGNWWSVIVWSDIHGIDRVALQIKESIGSVRLVYFNGSTWIQAGVPYVVSYTDLQTYDFNFSVGSGSGHLRLYNAGVKRIESGGINLSSIPALASMRLQGAVSGFGTGVASNGSQIIVASESTIGWKMTTYVPSGAGDVSDWAGTYADIDEVIYNDANSISTPTTNKASNFALTPVAVPTGPQIKAIVVTARGRRGTVAPSHIELSIDSTGTNHFGPSLPVDEGFSPYIAIWDKNPESGAKWTAPDLVALKAGVKALA
jgi:hypothetical protein